MIKTILWDVDGTLLDFKAAESAAIKSLFEEFSLGTCSENMLQRYSQINSSYWQRLEANEITKPQVLVGRFQQFFGEIGVNTAIAEEFNRQYQIRLGDTVVYRDNSIDIIKKLRGKIKQYVVTNGTIVAQKKKLRLSGLGDLMDGIFISDEIGVEKPNRAFFDAVFNTVQPENLSEVIIVGDSLTSDIRGGNNAGILTCWYNPEQKPQPQDYRIDYVISDLHRVLTIIDTQ
ncbi:MAG: YjjG family noncanonical pyrimidine nucleotidase [Firmicutes bacterium]|nr:YjjG family noncanonical pyrimidine nucleotidase [Bacillota bacterium]